MPGVFVCFLPLILSFTARAASSNPALTSSGNRFNAEVWCCGHCDTSSDSLSSLLSLFSALRKSASVRWRVPNRIKSPGIPKILDRMIRWRTN